MICSQNHFYGFFCVLIMSESICTDNYCKYLVFIPSFCSFYLCLFSWGSDCWWSMSDLNQTFVYNEYHTCSTCEFFIFYFLSFEFFNLVLFCVLLTAVLSALRAENVWDCIHMHLNLLFALNHRDDLKKWSVCWNGGWKNSNLPNAFVLHFKKLLLVTSVTCACYNLLIIISLTEFSLVVIIHFKMG